MEEKNCFYLVNQTVLPAIFMNVIKTKNLLTAGKAATIHDAVKQTGISRSAFYKYKDAVFTFTEGSRGKIITLLFVLEDIPGVLSLILNVIAQSNGNILTINQNIPVHEVANVTISMDTISLTEEQDALIQNITCIHGVRKVEILAKE